MKIEAGMTIVAAGQTAEVLQVRGITAKVRFENGTEKFVPLAVCNPVSDEPENKVAPVKRKPTPKTMTYDDDIKGEEEVDSKDEDEEEAVDRRRTLAKNSKASASIDKPKPATAKKAAPAPEPAKKPAPTKKVVKAPSKEEKAAPHLPVYVPYKDEAVDKFIDKLPSEIDEIISVTEESKYFPFVNQPAWERLTKDAASLNRGIVRMRVGNMIRSAARKCAAQPKKSGKLVK